MPIATMLMHGSVWGRAMDLMLWKRKKKKKMQEERVQRERREKQNPKNNIRIVKKGK